MGPVVSGNLSQKDIKISLTQLQTVVLRSYVLAINRVVSFTFCFTFHLIGPSTTFFTVVKQKQNTNDSKMEMI